MPKTKRAKRVSYLQDRSMSISGRHRAGGKRKSYLEDNSISLTGKKRKR